MGIILIYRVFTASIEDVITANKRIERIAFTPLSRRRPASAIVAIAKKIAEFSISLSGLLF